MILYHNFSIMKDGMEVSKKYDVSCHYLNYNGFPVKGKLNLFCDAAISKSTFM
jgi:hypothetical protein